MKFEFAKTRDADKFTIASQTCLTMLIFRLVVAACSVQVASSAMTPSAESRSLKRLPTRAEHTDAELHTYWSGVQQLRDVTTDPAGLASFAVGDAFTAMHVNTTGVPDALSGPSTTNCTSKRMARRIRDVFCYRTPAP